jgi:cytoskeletal protein RodZ
MNLDIPQVAEATKLKSDHIRALEEGDFEAFTAPVYLRGSLRTYAKLLKLDPARLVEELDAEVGSSGRVEEPSLAEPRKKTGLDSFMLLLSRVNWLIAAALVLVVLLGFGLSSGYRAWRNHKTADPLKKLGPGMYQPPANSGETLPLPTNAVHR